MKTLRQQYWSHKSTSKSRNIDFNLTFNEWKTIWDPYLHNRGTRPDQYCMARLNDSGAYELGNVKIITNSENLREEIEYCIGGEKCHKAKLTEVDIRYIRQSVKTNKELANELQVTVSNIRLIKQRITWKNI